MEFEFALSLVAVSTTEHSALNVLESVMQVRLKVSQGSGAFRPSQVTPVPDGGSSYGYVAGMSKPVANCTAQVCQSGDWKHETQRHVELSIVQSVNYESRCTS